MGRSDGFKHAKSVSKDEDNSTKRSKGTLHPSHAIDTPKMSKQGLDYENKIVISVKKS